MAVRGEDGGFRLTILSGGPPDPWSSWLELIGSFVRVETEPAADSAVRATSLEVLDRSPWPAPAPTPAATDPAGLTWPDLTGATQSLEALRGRVTVVNFWATWCKPCVEEMPVLAAVQADYAPLGVQLVGIAADAPEAARDVLAFAREAGVTFPVWLGATTPDMAAFGVGPALPATVVLDREGEVVHRVAGIVDGDALRSVLDGLLAALPGDGGSGKTAQVAVAANRHQNRGGEASLVPS